MSPEESQRKLQAQGAKDIAVQQAQENVSDIRTLEQTPAFARYYVRSLREMREKLVAQACEYLEPLEQAKLVAQIKLLDDLLKMPERDRVTAHKVLQPEDRG
jgi:uncharacterized pyridoxal phosphate-containing UPF0001 family protein